MTCAFLSSVLLQILRQFNATVGAVFSGHDHDGGYAQDPESGIHFVGVQARADEPDA